MQFYNYDMSESVPIHFAANGLYQLQPKEAYWAQFLVAAFLIKVDGELAGFAVLDTETSAPDRQYNLGYFFVARRYRKQGVGRAAVLQLMSNFPGSWEIYHLVSNLPAAKFWQTFFSTAHMAALTKNERLIHDELCTLYQFTI